jgi:hypothetical protein
MFLFFYVFLSSFPALRRYPTHPPHHHLLFPCSLSRFAVCSSTDHTFFPQSSSAQFRTSSCSCTSGSAGSCNRPAPRARQRISIEIPTLALNVHTSLALIYPLTLIVPSISPFVYPLSPVIFSCPYLILVPSSHAPTHAPLRSGLRCTFPHSPLLPPRACPCRGVWLTVAAATAFTPPTHTPSPHCPLHSSLIVMWPDSGPQYIIRFFYPFFFRWALALALVVDCVYGSSCSVAALVSSYFLGSLFLFLLYRTVPTPFCFILRTLQSRLSKLASARFSHSPCNTAVIYNDHSGPTVYLLALTLPLTQHRLNSIHTLDARARCWHIQQTNKHLGGRYLWRVLIGPCGPSSSITVHV